MEARARVATARESGSVGSLGQAEGGLRATLGQLFAVAEAYPDLKTDQTFQQLQTRISALENAIADRREEERKRRRHPKRRAQQQLRR